MRKRVWILALAALWTASSALAEVYTGQTVAAETLRVEAEQGAALSEVCVEAGDQVAEGATLAQVRATRVFASQDGTVARLLAEEGDSVDGSVLELSPVSLYTIYCTVDSAYSAADTKLIHSGEALYIRCTANGTHRATGIVTQIDSDEYRVLTTGGELYVGETVYLYRDADFTTSQRVGIGTVVGSEVESYEAAGVIQRICVEEGETVERGELLYEYTASDEAALVAPADGIVVEVDSEAGAFTVAPLNSICVEAQVDEETAARLSVGDTLSLSYASDPEEAKIPGEITRISAVTEDGLYTVRIAPEETPERLGLSVTVYFD